MSATSGFRNLRFAAFLAPMTYRRLGRSTERSPRARPISSDPHRLGARVSPVTSVTVGAVVGLLVAMIRLCGWAWEGAALAVGVLLGCVALSRFGRSARVSPVPRAISPKERWLIGLAALAVILPSLLTFEWTGGINVHNDLGMPGRLRHDHGPVVLAMMIIAVVSATLILFSGLIDWFYIRPQLRGGAGSVCATSFEERRWKSVTRLWLIHRAVATLGPIAGMTAIVALAANTWIRPIDTTVAGAIAAVATIVGGYYITRIAPLIAIAVTPPVRVGDVVEIAEEFNVHEPEQLREYFVADVALEGVKLLSIKRDGNGDDLVRRSGRDDVRTHDRMIDLVDIGRLLRRRRPVGACPGKCQKLTEHCACDTPWDGVEASAASAGYANQRTQP
jgi:MFS family permease